MSKIIFPKHMQSFYPIEANDLANSHAFAKDKVQGGGTGFTLEKSDFFENLLDDLKDSYEILSHCYRQGEHHVVAEGDEHVVGLQVEYNRASMTVFGEDHDKAQAIADAFYEKWNYEGEPIVPDPDLTRVNIWNFNGPPYGPDCIQRRLRFQPWEEIRNNYNEETRGDLDFLMKHRPEQASGVMVWTGPPGTGKTTAIRTLAREWGKFAAVHIISDTEVFLNDPKYLYQVCTNGGETAHDVVMESLFSDGQVAAEPERDNANLIILEDSGELLTEDAAKNSGQALSRLLNFTDGILGQGLNVYFLITTNEHFDALHAALVRPGRAIPRGVSDFTNLDLNSAAHWLMDHGIDAMPVMDKATADGKSELSLAELYAIKNEAHANEPTLTTA